MFYIRSALGKSKGPLHAAPVAHRSPMWPCSSLWRTDFLIARRDRSAVRRWKHRSSYRHVRAC